MKNLSLLLLFLVVSICVNAQIKIFPGGPVSIGTTNAPSSYYRTLFSGPTNFTQNGYDQQLINLDGVLQPNYANMMISNSISRKVKNYVVSFKGNHTFCVYTDGGIWAREGWYYSDSTLKTQISTIDSSLHKLLQLNPVSYKYKTDVSDTSIYGGANAKQYIGVLAQELNTIAPELVDTNENGIMAVNYDGLATLAIGAIQDLNTKITRMDYWQKDTATGNINYDTGNVGIGTSTPEDKLTVIGEVGFKNDLTDLNTYIIRTPGGEPEIGQLDSTGRFAGFQSNVNYTKLIKYGGGNEFVFDNTTGFVGIGTTPTAKLQVYANYDVAGPTKAGYFYATGNATTNYGIHAYAPVDTGYAAYLQGDVMVTGTLYTPSDEKLKTNIRPLENNTLAKINNLGVGSYEFNSNMQGKHNFAKGPQIGIMAQDIERQWPHLVNTDKHPTVTDPTDSTAVPVMDEFKVVNYTGLIPVLVKGIQELDSKVNTLKPTTTDSVIKALAAQNAVLKAENEDLKKDVASIKDVLAKFGDDLQYCCFNHDNNNQRPTGDGSILEQNNPNPFTENTVIRYYISQQATNASIRVVNLNGTILNTFKIDSKGAGQILISGNSMQAGTYVYELIVDGKQVDTKRMVLTY
ncbi:MAG: tail fiber domain-containing protein [Sphingobacteriales bacterium JAD_PAG50586_3]|nr:MAG: tail fiber domain-containing protein [Sphingobacteriales bacterium JAD_PAG50586_3]